MTIEELLTKAYRYTAYKDVRIFSIEERYRHGIITESDARALLLSIMNVSS